MKSRRLSSILTQPFEAAILLAFFCVGALFLLGLVVPSTGLADSASLSTLTVALEVTIASLWVVGGSLGLLGHVYPQRIKGLLLERGALYLVAVGALVNAAVAAAVSGPSGLGLISLLVSVVVACAIRIRRIPDEARDLLTFQELVNRGGQEK